MSGGGRSTASASQLVFDTLGSIPDIVNSLFMIGIKEMGSLYYLLSGVGLFLCLSLKAFQTAIESDGIIVLSVFAIIGSAGITANSGRFAATSESFVIWINPDTGNSSGFIILIAPRSAVPPGFIGSLPSPIRSKFHSSTL